MGYANFGGRPARFSKSRRELYRALLVRLEAAIGRTAHSHNHRMSCLPCPKANAITRRMPQILTPNVTHRDYWRYNRALVRTKN